MVNLPPSEHDSHPLVSVVDRLCEEHHRQHGVVVTSSLAYTKLCSNIEQDTETIDTRNTII